MSKIKIQVPGDISPSQIRDITKIFGHVARAAVKTAKIYREGPYERIITAIDLENGAIAYGEISKALTEACPCGEVSIPGNLEYYHLRYWFVGLRTSLEVVERSLELVRFEKEPSLLLSIGLNNQKESIKHIIKVLNLRTQEDSENTPK